jgi:glutamate/tyrosine decarboxylase-like PLP-dependent enzyme
MSRRFRGLAAWCALKAFGRSGYRDLVERCCANAARFAAWVEAGDGLELQAPATLNIVCFRYTPPGSAPSAIDSFNRDATERLQRDGRAFVTGTTWRGRVAIRAAFDNWATTADDVDILCHAVADCAAWMRTRT